MIATSSSSSESVSLSSSDLTALFIYLIELCVNQSPAEEQQSIAQLIEPLFDTIVEVSPSTYGFLAPVAVRKKMRKPAAVHTKGGKKKHEDAKVKKKKKAVITAKKAMKSPRAGAKAKKKSSHSTAASPTAAQQEPKSPTPSTSKDSRPPTSSYGGISYRLPAESPKNEPLASLTQDETVQKLLKAIELSADDLTTIVLCKLLRGYASFCKTAVMQRRLRRLGRLDAASYCLRAMRALISEPNPSPLRIMAIDALAQTLLTASLKDRKFTLKVRLSGMLSVLASRVLEADRLWCTVPLLRLTCRTLRSPRNAQMMGKERKFAERFVGILSAYNAIECEVASDTGTIGAETLGRAEGLSAADKMARLVEIFFFVCKNKRNKSHLIDEGAVGVLRTIFEGHFNRRTADPVHFEIALISVASLRQLARTKKGKDQLMTLNVLETCEMSIRLLADDRKKLSGKPKLVAPYVQLQDSLCALCMRCLPQVPFPMPNIPFPLTFPLPAQPAPLTPVSRNLRSSQAKPPTKSPAKARLLAASSQGKSSESATDSAIDDPSPSSDEDGGDEEEESFRFFNTSTATAVSMLGDDTLDMAYSEDDTDAANAAPTGAAGSSADGTLPVSKYSSQKLADLKANYRQHFSEFEQGAVRHGALSPKHRKTATQPIPMPSYRELIEQKASSTKSVGRFVKVAYPELVDPDIRLDQQPLLQNQESMKEMIIQEMARSRLQSTFQPRVVFDLDRLVAESSNGDRPSEATLPNNDLDRLGSPPSERHLKFESRFESGNLRRAIQVNENHYELILSPDINQARPHYQWFYFEVSNNKANVPYTFEIINCLKNTSMFSKGMQPVLFSVTEAKQGRPGWVHAGSSVCYYRNLYTPPGDTPQDEGPKKRLLGAIFAATERPTRRAPLTNAGANSVQNAAGGGAQGGADKSSGTDSDSPTKTGGNSETKSFFSIRFTVKFRHAADVCYIAYHFPYTYSYLQATLESWLARCSANSSIYARLDHLPSTTLAGNSVPVVTVTAPGTAAELADREIVVLSARVHPGESNSSWIMHGVLRFLLSESPKAVKAREQFVFKLVPMLNPDGVINGSHRCSLAGVDLNRVWDRPSATLHPTIHHTKGLIQYMVDVLKKVPYVLVDIHGHSRKANIFMFGNNPEESWRLADHAMARSGSLFSLLPELLEQVAPGFSLKDCKFSVTKTKEPSARIALWRQFGIERCYTMESTYCGFDTGAYSGKQIGIHELKEMGERLCEVFVPLREVLEGLRVPRAEAVDATDELLTDLDIDLALPRTPQRTAAPHTARSPAATGAAKRSSSKGKPLSPPAAGAAVSN